MEFEVLGSIRARHGEQELPLGGPKQRALLAILLLNANEVVPRERLIDGLWGAQQPPTAEHTLDNYVSRLRGALGEGRLSRRPPGYVLAVHPGELDVERFESLFTEGREQLIRGAAAEAAATLRSALELWRGTALADVLYEPFAAHESERLEERRLSALEQRIEADLALGRTSELVPELERLSREHPFRERPLTQLMLALYRAGRQTDALTVFQARRQRLSEELGLEPGPQLQELQRKILEHDPSLSQPGVPRLAMRVPSRRARRSLAALGVAAVVATGVAAGIILGTSGGKASGGDATSSGIIALPISRGDAGRSVEMSGTPAAVVATADSIWTADPNGGTVSRVDLGSRSVVDRVPVDGSPGAIAAGAGSLWVTTVPGGRITRIDPGTGAVTQTIDLGGARASALAFGEGGLWVADLIDTSLIELAPGSGTARRTLSLDMRPTALAITPGTIWVAGYADGQVEQVDLDTGQTVATVRVGNGPAALVAGLGGVWVVNSLDSTVSRIDATTGTVTATIPVGSGPSAIAVAGGSIWVANEHSATVSRIDPQRNTVVGSAPTGGSPTALTSAQHTIWVGIRPLDRHQGGSLVLLHSRSFPIDPALSLDLLTPVSDGLTGDGLVTYNHTGGPAGIHLVPDLAVSLPVPTDSGTTYTFRLRPGIRYSDGRMLRTADFRRAIERLFRLRSDGSALFDGIRGAGLCNPSHCDLSAGIVSNEAARTVTFRLRAADPDFLESLATHGLAMPVPEGTPFRAAGFEPIPGTGPYKIASATEREIRYVRNPFFHEWSHAAQPSGNPDEIVTRFGLSAEQEVREIRNGRADWMAENIPARLLPELRTQFAGRLHGFSIPTTDFFQLNTRLPPFDDIRVRRALNFAIDRRAIVRIYGGRDLASPTCQILPPGVVGYRSYCPYTRNPNGTGTWVAPDLARARRLVAESGTRDMRITVWGWTDDPTISPRVIRYTATVLRELGYRSTVRLVPHSYFNRNAEDALATIQIIAASWGDTAYGFFATWFACRGASNHGYFCDRRIDGAIARAQSLKGTDPRRTAARWAEIDRRLVDRAVWAPLVDEHMIDFVSARVRNYQAHPYWGIIADQLWID
jgi:peptide/nickel transport system substrate-binding protein